MNTFERKNAQDSISFWDEVTEDYAYEEPNVALCCHVAKEAVQEQLGKPVKKTKTFSKHNLKHCIAFLQVLLLDVDKVAVTYDHDLKYEYVELALQAVTKKLEFHSNQHIEDDDKVDMYGQ